MSNTFIVDGLRTPIGNFRGTLSPVRTDDLAALPIKKLMERNSSVPMEAIEDVIMGCANQAGEDNRNINRSGKNVQQRCLQPVVGHRNYSH